MSHKLDNSLFGIVSKLLNMAAPASLGVGAVAGCGLAFAQHIWTDAREQQSVREMTAHLMSVKRSYANTVAALGAAARREEQRLLHPLQTQASSSELPLTRPMNPSANAAI